MGGDPRIYTIKMILASELLKNLRGTPVAT